MPRVKRRPPPSEDEDDEEEDDEREISRGIPPPKIIDGARKSKILLYDGHIFHHGSTVKQSSYFKCAHTQKGCGASIILKRFNKQKGTYASYVISKGEHLNHLPDSEKLHKKEEKGRHVGERKLTDVTSEEFRNRKHLCLFCLKVLPLQYLEIRTLENIQPSGDILTIPLDDPVKNCQAFDLLCSLLNVRWRRSWEGQSFDQNRCLPLCFKCQNVYQEINQVHQQIRELEGVLNGHVKAVRESIERSHREESDRKTGEESLEGGARGTTQLELLGLHVFRKKVVDPTLTRIGENEWAGRESPQKKKRRSDSSPDSGPVPKQDKFPDDIPDESPLLTEVKQEVDDVDQTLSELLEVNGDDPPDWTVPEGRETGRLSEMSDSQSLDRASIVGAAGNSCAEATDSDLEESVVCTPRRRSRRVAVNRGKADTDFRKEVLSEEEEEELPQEGGHDFVATSGSREESGSESSSEDSDFSVAKKKSSRRRRRPARKKYVPKSGSRSRSSFFKKAQQQSSVSYYKTRKMYSCHICSAPAHGHAAFMKHYQNEHPDERLFSCKFCQRHFDRLQDVIMHQRYKHSKERPYQCPSCPRAFPIASLLQKHVTNRHSQQNLPEPLQCTQCEKEFPSKTILANHLVAEHGETPKKMVYPKSKRPVEAIPCHICDTKFFGRGPLLQHYEEKHPTEKKFSCRFCGWHFPYIRQCLRHQRRKHTGETPYECQDCSLTFVDEFRLQYHRKTRHPQGSKVHGCPLCPKVYYIKASLTTHMYSHRVFILVCKECGKVFQTRNSFTKHNRLVHNGKAESSAPISNPTKEALEGAGVGTDIKMRRKCHLCLAPVAGKKFIQQHFQECHPDHPGGVKTCRCGKQFGCYQEVYNHAVRMHLRDKMEKPYQCDKCPRSFFTCTELRGHSKTHIPVEERQKEHICSVCGLGLSSSFTLSQHMKMHEKQTEAFVCDICGKQYTYRRGLHEHTKTAHLKIRPHSCATCGKSFTQLSILQRHMNVHTMQTEYKCDLCAKVFPYSSSLSRHMKEVHKQAQEDGGKRKRRKKEKATTLVGPKGQQPTLQKQEGGTEETGGDLGIKDKLEALRDYSSGQLVMNCAATTTTALYTPSQYPHYATPGSGPSTSFGVEQSAVLGAISSPPGGAPESSSSQLPSFTAAERVGPHQEG